MTQKEHLQIIRARCVELLEQAKLRTPGVWKQGKTTPTNVSAHSALVAVTHKRSFFYGKDEEANAAYIANASVAFEAALESTIAAIDGADEIMLHYSSVEHNTLLHALVEEQRNDIIAAWKHLLP